MAVVDGSGNVTELIDGAGGAVAASFQVDPYGKLLSSNGPPANLCPFVWQSHYRDSESGLTFAPNRVELPSQGRWLQRDPSGESGGLNLYLPDNGDPINETDSTGMAPHSDSVWTPAKVWAAGLMPSKGIDASNQQALQAAYDNDAAFQSRVNGLLELVESSRGHGPPMGWFETLFPATAQSIGATNVSSEYVQWHDAAVSPLANHAVGTEAALLGALPATIEGPALLLEGGSVLRLGYAAALTYWGVDNTVHGLTLTLQGKSNATARGTVKPHGPAGCEAGSVRDGAAGWVEGAAGWV